ncbi:MAG: NAD(P)-dependent alcohol dehydrogenase [Deltaproteobacteria bacterium]|nr:MAG: NAD(P)-dependent alcohol dehydrogenase [Deltaproteobacteria bacterium]
MTIQAYAVQDANGKLEPFTFEPGPLAATDLEIKVTHCGICHSDLSMLQNDWSMTQYPFVPGHEVVGEVVGLGDRTHGFQVGQRVGVGWFRGSCMHCEWCMQGEHALCSDGEGTIVGHHGGFADKIRVDFRWAIPLPHSIDSAEAAPLLCGGITVYNPLVAFNVPPTARVGVIGIGGLGHMAVRFANAWGCEVTAFSSSPSKEEEARSMGAHHFINSRDNDALKDARSSFDFIISTVNVDLDWNKYINALRPKGTLCLVGAVLNPIPVSAFSLIGGQKRIVGNPTGSPQVMKQMFDFAARHDLGAIVQTRPMSQANEALEDLDANKARYRLVLEADF